MAKKKGKGGAKGLLREARHEALVEVMAGGGTKKEAAGVAGIGYATFLRWLARGREELARVDEDPARRRIRAEEKPYTDLVLDIDGAITQRIQETLEAMRAAGLGADGDWRALKEWLKMAHPGRFSEKMLHELTGKDGGPIQTEDPVKAELIELIVGDAAAKEVERLLAAGELTVDDEGRVRRAAP